MECGSEKIVADPYDHDDFEAFAFNDYGCLDCHHSFDVEEATAFAKSIFQDLDRSQWSQFIGTPDLFPTWVYHDGVVAPIDKVVVTEKQAEFYRDPPKPEFTVRKESLDFRDETKADRRDLKNRNLDQLFGETNTYECRICGRVLDDGRKNYCSDFCRQNAYRFAEKYHWNAARRKALERDNYTCQADGCNKSVDPEKEEQDVELEVDHIEAVAKGGSMHDPDNLKTLCKQHHREKSRREGDYSFRSKPEVKIKDYTENGGENLK